MLMYWLQQGVNAVQLGSIYALIALGYSLVYGVLSMINFAHGDIFMVGAFVCLFAATQLGLPCIPTLLCTIGVAALLGAGIERVAYRPLRQAPRVSAVITALGVGLCLENVMLALNPYPQNVPQLLADERFAWGGLGLSSVQLLVIGVSTGLVLMLDRIVHHSRMGMAMRAIAWDRASVPLMGVPVDRVIAFTFALGAGLAGAAGVLYSMAYPVIDPGMGIMVGWKAFIATVVGGIGRVRGALLGAYLLGGIEILVVALLPSTFRDLVVFSLLLGFVVIRPYGLLGRPTVQKV